jgi:Uma2 family endonuclease
VRRQYQFEGLFLPGQALAHPYLYVPFEVSPRCTRLEVAYQYSAGNPDEPWLGGELLFLVRLYLSKQDLGWVFPQETGMAIWPNRPRHVRKPDLAFVRRGRLPEGRPGEGWLSVAPDLVVEVVSPGDTVEELEEKLDEYREAGIPLIWVIYPSLEKAHVLRAGRERTELTAEESLDGEDVLPGFRASLAELFAASREEK